MTIKAIETKFDGRRFRSRTEARWAVFFKALGWSYEYEKEGYDLDGDWYLPDFYLPASDLFVEVKGGDPTTKEIALCRRLAEETGKKVVLVVGGPEAGKEQGILFDRDLLDLMGEIPVAFLQDRRNDGEYWLAADDQGFGTSIGPVFGPNHDRHPLLLPEIKAAFAAAQSARFEHGEEG